MKTKAAELLRSVAESRRPVIITQSGEPKGALTSTGSAVRESWSSPCSTQGAASRTSFWIV
jgi:prevent-host-death family protein